MSSQHFHPKRVLKVIDPEAYQNKIRQTAWTLGIDPDLIGKESEADFIAEAVYLTPLPDGWVRCSDEDNKPYYFDYNTNSSQWHHPLSFKFQAAAKKLTDKQNGVVPPVNKWDLISDLEETEAEKTDTDTVGSRGLVPAMIATGAEELLAKARAEKRAKAAAEKAAMPDAHPTANTNPMNNNRHVYINNNNTNNNPGQAPNQNQPSAPTSPPRLHQSFPTSPFHPHSFPQHPHSQYPGQMGKFPPHTYYPQPPRTAPAKSGGRRVKRSHNGRKNGSLKHGNTAAHTDDDMMKLFKPGSTQLKSSQQKVNEALRHKLSQMVVVRQKLERKLSSTVNEVTRTRVCNSKLKKLLSRCYIRLNLISERIKLRSKSRAGMSGVDGRVTHTASAAEQEMDMAFDEEYHQTRATISKLLGYLNYGKQVYSYVDQVRERLQNQLMDTNAVLQLDRQCLELGGSGSAHRRKLTTGGGGGGGGGGGKMFNKSARRRLASANASPTNMITIHQLFEHESAIKRSAQSFAQQANKCLEEETKKIKEVYRKSNIAIRTCLRQSGELKNHIQIEILANKAKIPVLIKREKELKSLLAQQFKPLELCQRRYEIRMERATNAMVSDLVQQELEEELEGLGEKVQRLESTLKHVQEELRILMDIDIQLKSQLLTEQNHMTFYQHCLDVEKKSEHDELQKHKKKTNGEDQDKASGSNEKKQLRGAHKQNHNKYTSNKKLYINHSNRTKKKNTTMSKSLPSSHSSRPTSSHQLKSPSVYGLSASSNRGMYASPTKHRSGNTKAGGEIRFSSYQ